MKKREWEHRKEQGEMEDEEGGIGKRKEKGSAEVGEAYALRTAEGKAKAKRPG